MLKYLAFQAALQPRGLQVCPEEWHRSKEVSFTLQTVLERQADRSPGSCSSAWPVKGGVGTRPAAASAAAHDARASEGRCTCVGCEAGPLPGLPALWTNTPRDVKQISLGGRVAFL